MYTDALMTTVNIYVLKVLMINIKATDGVIHQIIVAQ